MDIIDTNVIDKPTLEERDVEFASDVIIVGGGPAAIMASQYLLRAGITTVIFEPRELARKVTHHDLHCLPGLPDVVSGKQIAEQLRGQVKCEVVPTKVLNVISEQPKIQAVYTEHHTYYCRAVLIATGLRKRDMGFNNEESFRSRGVYIYLDAIPNSECVAKLMRLDQYGFIQTGENMMTETPGIFAAGDIRTKYLRQFITAVSDGATAAMAIENYLRE